MLAAAVPSTFAAWLLLGGGFVFIVLKGMERFGWLRTPTQWKTECEALQRECDRLNIRIVVLEKEVIELRGDNQVLRSKPDVSALYELMQEHDSRENRNHEATVAA